MITKPSLLKGYYEFYFCFYNEKINYYKTLHHNITIFTKNFRSEEEFKNEEIISNIKEQLIEKEKEKFSEAIDKEINIQNGLMFKYISVTNQTGLGIIKMNILAPILCWESGRCIYVFPVALFFEDGRIIIKYSFDVTLFDKNKSIDISEQYRVVKKLNSYDYFDIKGDLLEKRTPQIKELEMCEAIEADFLRYNQLYNSIKTLFIRYETLTITEIERQNSYKKYDDFFMCIAHAPVDTMVPDSFKSCKIDFGYVDFNVTPTKSVLYFKSDLVKKIEKKFEAIEDEMLLANLGSYYPALFKALLKKYRLMYCNRSTLQKNIIEKKNSDIYTKDYLFKLYETDIIYSYYDSVIKLDEKVDSLIIPNRTIKHIEELSVSRERFEKYTLESQREKIESFFTMIAFILTLVLSFEAIESMMDFFGFWKYSFIVYLIFNVIIFIGYFIYKWKLKRK